MALWKFAARRRSATALNLPPGKLEWPIGGLQFLTGGFNNVCAYEGEGPRKMRFLGKPTILVRAFDQIKLLLNSDEDLTEVAWPPATLAMLGPHSVTFATGAYHRSLRRLLGPCFAPQAIESYLPAIQRLCERYCERWAAATAQAAGGRGHTPGGESGPTRLRLELLPKMQEEGRQLTFEVMAHVVAGFRFSPQQLARLSDAFDDLMRGIFHPLALAIPGTPFAKAVVARKVLVAALNQQLDAFAAERTKQAAAAAAAEGTAKAGPQGGGGKGTGKATVELTADGSGKGAAAANGGGKGDGSPFEGGSVMERLLGMRTDDGRPLSRVALQDLGVGLLFAGHETTASTLVRLMLRLRTRPDVVSRLREEQAAAVRKHGQEVTGAALRDMPYLDAVLKEGWRVDPLVPMVIRRAKRPFRLAGYDIPQGWTMFVGLSEPLKGHPTWRGLPEDHPMHPAAFNPDRWIAAAPAAAAAAASEHDEDGDGDGSSPASSASLPAGHLSSPLGMLPPSMLTFGGGNRYCLGTNLAWAELKTFLCVLVRKYDFAAPLERMDVKVFPSLNITEGFPLQVFPRGEAVAAA